MKRWLIFLAAVIIIAAGTATDVLISHHNKNKNTQTQSNYLVIKEWGVEFKLPAAYTSDIYYHYDSSTDSVTFGSKQYSRIQPYCGADKTGFKDGLIRFKNGEDIPTEGPIRTKVAEVNGNKFYIRSGGATCDPDHKLSNDQAVQLSEERVMLDDSFSSLTGT